MSNSPRPRDGREFYVFSSRGKHLRTVDALLNVRLYEFGYDAAGRLSTVTDRDNNSTTIERDADGDVIAIVSPHGQRSTVTLDANGYLQTLTNPNNETTTFAYSAKGLLERVTDARTNQTTFGYDAQGRLIQKADPAGGSDGLARAELTNGYQVTHTTGEGVATGYKVEFLSTGDRRMTTLLPDGTAQTTLNKIDGTTQVTQPDGITQASADAGDPRFGMQSPITKSETITTPGGLTANLTSGRTVTLANAADPSSLTNQTDTVVVNGRTITRSYNVATRTITDTTPQGRVSRTVLDGEGRPIQVQTGNLTATQLSYDTQGRINGMARGTRTNTLAYDTAGNLASLTDPLSRTVTFAYDAAGRVTTQTLPDTRAISFSYDANSNVSSITPPARPAHQFDYTTTNLQSAYLPPPLTPNPLTPNTLYEYDRDQRLTRITRPDGQQVNLDYHPLTHQLAKLRLPSGQLTYVYDVGTGNLQQAIAPDGGTVSYGYDGTLPESETWSGGIAGSVERSYDTSFRVATQSVNGSNSVLFSYDNDDLLTNAGAMTFGRDATNGLITGSTLGSVSDTLGYNTFGEATSYSATFISAPLYAVTYTRDDLGRIASKTETIDGVTTTFAYGYDQAGRLTDVTTNATPTAHYDYDGNSNRIGGFTSQGTITGAQYDNQDRLLAFNLGLGALSYSYSPNGELQSKTDTTGTTTYQYDVLGNLKQVVPSDGRVIEYVIDGTNRRIGKKVNGTLVQGFLYDGQLRVVAELDGSGNVVNRFVYGTKVNVPEYMVHGGVTYRIVTDQLGSPRLIVNTATGVVAQRVDYDEFGNVLVDTAAGFQPFGFAGGLYDSDTKLVRFGARDYDAQTGRWTAKDLIGFRGRGLNLYGYVLNDAVNAIDPGGRVADSLAVTLGNISLENVLVGTALTGTAITILNQAKDHNDDLIETVGVPEEPFPQVGPPEEPGEFLRACLGIALQKFQAKHNPFRLALDIATCFGLAGSH
ncbi:MAG: RHS repeat-associated core domain-containing protein [Deltaproteobacteria bacterium]|nr:RHS repeat-associated core domain-containing protein [Deltaproteobacteria bacterium]